ncbi:MAG: hypothetical protein JWM28_1138 [Chitinophagaceae bacterium]|nr:hypothetical protein [Chitinophagaceae bacterium]
MQLQNSKTNWLSFAGFLLVLPAAYLIIISVLKYNLKIDGPFNASQPFLERLGIKEQLGWNINLLILIGPLLAITLTIFQVLKIEFHFAKEQFHFHIIIQKKWFPILVAAFGMGVMAILFLYLAGENCK